MATKNNPQNRGENTGVKKVNGKEIKPVFYIGKHLGHGNYMAGQSENGQMILDSKGIPLPFSKIRGDNAAPKAA